MLTSNYMWGVARISREGLATLSIKECLGLCGGGGHMDLFGKGN